MFSNDGTLKTDYRDIVKRKLSHEIECKIIQFDTTNTSSKTGKITMSIAVLSVAENIK
jgi:hypothetical protein